MYADDAPEFPDPVPPAQNDFPVSDDCICPHCGELGDREYLPFAVDLCRYRNGGDQYAFRRFLDVIDRPLERYLRDRFRDDDAALCGIQDIMIETMIRILRALPNYRCRPNPWPWVRKIAHRKAIDGIRYKQKRIPSGFQPSPKHDDNSDRPADRFERTIAPGEHPVIIACRNERAAQLHDALNRLSEPDRTIVALHMQQKSYAQIAEEKGIAPSTAYRRLANALKQLSTFLSDDK